MRLFAMLGFYSYQTYDRQHLQNDALLAGAGLEIKNSKFSFTQSLSGYRGYLENGDRPMVYKTSLQWKRRRIDAKLWYQWGLNDFPYHSIRAGLVYHVAL